MKVGDYVLVNHYGKNHLALIVEEYRAVVNPENPSVYDIKFKDGSVLGKALKRYMKEIPQDEAEAEWTLAMLER